MHVREKAALALVLPPVTQTAADSPSESRASSDLDLATTFRRYSPYVAAVAYRLLGRDDEVDDTVQEVFLAATRGLSGLRDPAAIKGWLACVTVRAAQRRMRMRTFRRFLGLDAAGVQAGAVDPSASPEQRALLSSVYDALEHLPANHRIAWVLRHIEGERLEDVAAMTGCSLATAKRRIAAAEAALDEVFR